MIHSTNSSSVPQLSTSVFKTLRDSINHRFGIFFNDGDRYLLESRLAPRLNELALTGFEQYVTYLSGESSPRELDIAIELLTNNETYFFREDYQLNAFSEELLPRLKVHNSKQKQITIWSAGCSSGEEVYSIVMLIIESGLFSGWNIRVLGSDVNSRILTKARTAVFGKSAFRNTPSYLKQKYFHKEGANWQLSKEVTEKSRFSKLNLLDDNNAFLLGKFDAIFCRNVLMYFDKKSRQHTIGTFYNRLNPDGYLLLGHTESLFNQKTPFVQVELGNALVYQKKETTFG